MSRVIVFIHRDADRTGKGLEASIKNSEIGSSYELYSTVAGLQCLLRGAFPHNNTDLFILFADTKKRLEELLTLKGLLADRWLLLVVPYYEKTIMARGNSLHPRFLFAPSSVDFEIIRGILNKKLSTVRLY